MKLKKIFRWRVIFLIVVLLLALFAISPNPWAEGLEIKYADEEAKSNGLNPGDIVMSINEREVRTISEFKTILAEESGNKAFNESAKLAFETSRGRIAFLAKEIPNIIVDDISRSNIVLGLDLAGGTRVLLKPEAEGSINEKQISDLISVLDNRLNVYGLSDLSIRSASDLEGNKFVLVEIAGATREEVRELIGKQGVFEARIGNESVFTGSKQDVTFVCKDDGSCSGIRSCDQMNEEQWNCGFEFVIHISPEAARRHAAVTKDLSINTTESGRGILEKTIDFYLDNKLVDSLNIDADLKGQEATSIAITGPGIGASQQEALKSAQDNMKKLQTILITGSLPLKLNIIKLDTISPLLGMSFINNAVLTGLVALLVVAGIIFIIYRKIKIIVPIIITILCEVFLILGIAAILGWRLDLAAIAGIIATIGTGVDDQIIMTDELIKGEEKYFNWKQKIKRAFGIILSAYATIFVAMIPLLFAGAGMLRGFALTTLIGTTVGILITRPAFASVIEVLLEE